MALTMGRRRDIDYLFAAICIIGAIINIDLALINLIPEERSALAAERFIYIVFVFGPAIYIQFIHRFLGVGPRWLEMVCYTMGAVFMALVFSDHFITGFHYHSFGRIAKGGWAYRVFTLYAALTVVYCLGMLYRALAGRSNVARNRIKYIMCGMGLGSILLALDIIPTFGYDMYPMGSLSFISAIIIAVGVMKYDLLDIGLIFRRALTYTILSVTLAGAYVVIASAFNVFLIAEESWRTSILPPIAGALVMVMVFDPVKTFIQGWVDRIFHRDRINYDDIVGETSSTLASLFSMSDIGRYVTRKMSNVLRVDLMSLCLRKNDAYVELDAPEGTVIPVHHPIISELQKRGAPLHEYQVPHLKTGDYAKAEIETLFRIRQIALVVPIIVRSELIGFFLIGQKMSGEVYFQEELRLLMTIANQTAIALENTRVMEEIKSWNETLEQKVRARTAELMRALEEKERAQKQMIQAESLAAIGQLVAGTAHELNNPLSSALSLLQSIAEEIAELPERGNGEIVADLEFVRKELQRAAGIVKSLLDVSRQTQTYTEEININEVIEDALRVLQNMIKKLDVKIIKNFSSVMPVIRGNFAQMGQVFINVIKNALQALPNGKGEIVLTTCHHETTEMITIECADSGVGIPDHVKNEIFNPFFTTKEVGMGTGLGLYISHELVRRHEGTITVEDRPGGGTVVRIELPMVR